MGLFSKLLGDAAGRGEALSSLKNAAKDIMNDVEKKAAALADQASEAVSAQKNAAHPAAAPSSPPAPRAASGDSWGKNMPAEENQFSFPGTYAQYFEMIFREDFPGYTVTADAADPARRTVFTLWQGSRRALVTEVMTERSASQKLRRDCEAAGTPYLRFYFDHDGWWNTRAYVVRRVKSAL